LPSPNRPPRSRAVRAWLDWFVLAWIALPLTAAETVSPSNSGNRLSLRLEIQNAMDKGLAWMESQQRSQGHWSNPEHPALTGLALVALHSDPDSNRVARATRRPILERGYAFLLSCAQSNGGIYVDKKLVNYNTSVSLMALLLSGNPQHEPVLRRARRFLASNQNDFGDSGTVDDSLDGGFGYGDGSKHGDAVNTLHALEALHHSRRLLQDQPSSELKDLNWTAAIQFLQTCQHLPGTNAQTWVSGDPANRGGFIYSPTESKAGEMTLPQGKVALRAYASISYAGMLSYIYAGLTPDDSRVQAVLDWAKQNYTLQENPGMGPQGLYFYFHTMAKALRAAGVDRLETPDGKRHDWRQDLSLRLFDLQKPDGRWENDNGRWWEKDPVLSTSYSLIALGLIHRTL